MRKALEHLTNISEHQVEGLMFHSQMADCYDFLGLKGFKRMHEYHYLKESLEMRDIHRYSINHCNHLILDGDISNPAVLPSTWKTVNRMQVTNEVRRQYVVEGFNRWLDWERKSVELYTSSYECLIGTGHLHAASKVFDLVKEVSKELKGLERRIIDLKTVDYDLKVIEPMQREIHDHYKKKKSRHL